MMINKTLYLLAMAVLLAECNIIPEGVTEELSPGRWSKKMSLGN